MTESARDAVGSLGIVVIGRDLGPRLELCLRSVVAVGAPVIYVDSRSTDGSDAAATSRGIPTVRLDPDAPLNASRARNEGFAGLLRAHPSLEFVQFVDGDCELHPEWVPHAIGAMQRDPNVGIVCGHVREKNAGQSVAATLLDVEWRGPVGEIGACGGIFAVRRRVFAEAGGFSMALPTGEEAELCGRIRALGWRIRRLDHAMCTHDADIDSIGAWLRRSVRVGRGYARSAELRGTSADPAARRRVRTVLFWALVLPLVALAGAIGAIWAPIAWVPSVSVLLLYVVQVARVAARQRRAGRALRPSIQYGFFNLIAKWAQLRGCIEYWTRGGRPEGHAPHAP